MHSINVKIVERYYLKIYLSVCWSLQKALPSADQRVPGRRHRGPTHSGCAEDSLPQHCSPRHGWTRALSWTPWHGAPGTSHTLEVIWFTLWMDCDSTPVVNLHGIDQAFSSILGPSHKTWMASQPEGFQAKSCERYHHFMHGRYTVRWLSNEKWLHPFWYIPGPLVLVLAWWKLGSKHGPVPVVLIIYTLSTLTSALTNTIHV